MLNFNQPKSFQKWGVYSQSGKHAGSHSDFESGGLLNGYED